MNKRSQYLGFFFLKGQCCCHQFGKSIQCLCQRTFATGVLKKRKKLGLGGGWLNTFCQGKSIPGCFYAMTSIYKHSTQTVILLAGKSPLEYITYPDIHNIEHINSTLLDNSPFTFFSDLVYIHFILGSVILNV